MGILHLGNVCWRKKSKSPVRENFYFPNWHCFPLIVKIKF